MAQRFEENELLERVDDDVGFLADTVGMLESDGPALMAQVDAALAAGDAPAAARAAHALKGMISNFCAPGVQALALDVEHAARGGDLAAAAPAAARLAADLEALISELTTFVKARTRCAS